CWLKFSLSLFCSGAAFLNPNLVQAQEFERLPEVPGIDTSQVQYVRGETVRDRNLEKVIFRAIEHLQDIIDEVETVYNYHKIDLNNDGYDEALVTLRGRAVCGTGGCISLIVQGTSSGYGSILLEHSSFGGWVVGTDTNNGWKNIYKADRCRPNDVREACYTVSQSDGSYYGLNRVISRITLRGQVLLASSEYHTLQTKAFQYSRCSQGDKYCIKRGDYGPAVGYIIELLIGKGYYQGKNDDIFGSATEAAIKNFQRDLGLTPDGIAGPSTIEELCVLDEISSPDISPQRRVQLGRGISACIIGLLYYPETYRSPK
ncbi:MAG: peptidoglycan-binding protein, partial [Symploca sp. SIO2G7]|nr:peptidoglycan-binding protein [Symploca sp. SIO2G7]